MPEPAEGVNVYVCRDCRHYMVTINRIEGVTPFNIACRKCGSKAFIGGATSLFYPRNAERAFGSPEYEWYRPEGAEFDALRPETQEHVRHGGLLLREIAK